MAKKRKTKNQKRLADLRHTFTHSTSYVKTPTLTLNSNLNQTKTLAKTISIDEYPYLKKDLLKTFLLTSGILIFQVLFFVSLKNHLFVIPGLNY